MEIRFMNKSFYEYFEFNTYEKNTNYIITF